jgi:hypothetical protein
MTERPDKVFAAFPIREKCGECDGRPIAVAVFPEDDANMIIGYACDDHLEQLALYVDDQGFDTEKHIFEITRTCLALEASGVPCGGAADFIVIRIGGASIMSICRRHWEEWRPETVGPAPGP